jgi:transcriptional regulator with XRE-family HTH domain
MGVETPPSRLKRAREAVGLDQHSVAGLAGINSPWYYDLEAYDHELASTLSLEKLCQLAEIVKTDPLVLLIGDGASSVERSLEFGDVVKGLAAQMVASGFDVEQFGERVGWELGKILADPNAIWDLNTDGFRDVAKAAGVEWSSAFPRARRSTAEDAV